MRARKSATVAIALAVATAAVFVAPMAAFAVATTGAPLLDITTSVRSEGMGFTGVADRDDADNVFFNPANVTAMDGVYTTGSYELLYPQISNDIWFGHTSAGAGWALGSNRPVLLACNVTLAKLSYGKRMATSQLGQPLGEYESKESYFALTVGVAGKVGEDIEWAAGAAFKRVSIDYAPSSITTDTIPSKATSGAFDIGTVVSKTIDASDWRVRPAVGLSVVNLGPDLEFDNRAVKDPLPSWFRYGIGVRIDGPVVDLGSVGVPVIAGTLDFDGSHGLNDQHPYWGFGYELAFLQIASARWGRRIDDHDRTPVDTWGVALGVPAGPVRARVDYATSSYRRDVFGVSLAWLFDRD
jgi:hypothetical protein